jgi:glycyl-tRNA synthetase beta chain
MTTRTLVIEVGCEELPSSALRSIAEGLHEGIVAGLEAHNLSHGETRWFATPRRLAVEVRDLVEEGPDQEQEALGPPLAQARDAGGAWTRAAEGFAARQEISTDELQVINTPKGERVGILRRIPGARTSDVLCGLLEDVITTLPIAKKMRWGASRLEFARPIHWLLVLFGDEHGFGEALGYTTGNTTRGHRFHAPGELAVARAEDYEGALRDAFVIADFQERCELIRQQVKEAAGRLNAAALIDPDLLVEVASLVEWPVALAGSFDEAFLRVPSEALISSMQSHQKYFPVISEDGTLLPHFITVSNIESRRPEMVVAGNEKVIRPRLADAAFFYDQDLKQTLASRAARLDDVVFQKDLGSIGDKSRRIARLAGFLAQQIGADRELAERAGSLCKADLVSEMVLEFADMQGVAGGYYARNDGEADSVAAAVTQHYWPLQAGSRLPEDRVALAVALADRLDTLVGIFGIGQAPTGSRDPFGLRRAAIAVLRILIEKELPLDLRDCVSAAIDGFDDKVLGGETADTVVTYLLDRMPALFEERGIPIEVFRAVRATACTEPVDFRRRLLAVHNFTARAEAEALAAANKRVSNILAKAEDTSDTLEVSANLLHEPAEIALAAAIATVASKNQEALQSANYDAALENLAGLRDSVDAFFDQVMVNADDPQQRTNRLALLAGLRREFTAIADISLLAG